jgi:hypothetical protein
MPTKPPAFTAIRVALKTHKKVQALQALLNAYGSNSLPKEVTARSFSTLSELLDMMVECTVLTIKRNQK